MPIYIVIKHSSLVAFQEKVNEYIEHGYLPIGGVSYGDFCYMQAMLKS